MGRGALAVAAGAFCLLGCAQLPNDWKRTDGLPIESGSLEAAKSACDGEATKANMAAGRSASIVFSGAMATVYKGCMADRGYLPER